MPDRPRPVLAGIGDEAARGVAEQVAAMAALGWSALELRTVDGVQIADVSLPDVRRIASATERVGISVCALCSGIGAWGRSATTPVQVDIDELDRLAERAADLDTRLVRVMSWANDGLTAEAWRAEVLRRMDLVVARAEELGLTLVHENCAGWAGQGPEQSLELFAAIDSPHLRAVFDMGNCVAYGQDPVTFVRAVVDRVEHVHVKDAVIGVDGSAEFVVPGEGDAAVLECLRVLSEAGYDGVFALEPHLHTAPHAGRLVSGSAAEDFLRCGRALEALVEAAWASKSKKELV